MEKSIYNGADKCVQAEGGGALGNMSMSKGELTQPTKKRQGHWRKGAATGIINTGKEVSIINDIGIQRGDCEGDNGVGICTSTPNSKSPTAPANEELVGVPPVTSEPESATSPVLPCYLLCRMGSHLAIWRIASSVLQVQFQHFNYQE